MPTTEIKRQDFLNHLELVQPGLAAREIADQATCFAFKDGKIYTFNEHVACQVTSGLPDDFTGAVQSRPLLEFLKKISDKKLRLNNGGGHLKLENDRMSCKIKMQGEVRLPIQKVHLPKKGQWIPMPAAFAEAAVLASDVVRQNDANPVFTSVHIHPKWIESATSAQCIRCEMNTKVKEPVLVRASSLLHVEKIGATKFAVTDEWIHFRTGKMVFSCRRFHEKYVARNRSVSEVIASVIKEKGKVTRLPTGLKEAVEAAKVFAAESDEKLLKVEVKQGVWKITATGVSGEYTRSWDLSYDGPEFEFAILPDLLHKIVKDHPTVELSKKQMRAVNKEAHWIYVATLDRPRKNLTDNGYKEKGDRSVEGDD